MPEQSFDPGLTQQYGGKIGRTINKDGSFNVRRTGSRLLDTNLYLFIVGVPWPAFIGLVLLAYVVTNTIFAIIYYWIGAYHLSGADVSTPGRAFASAFFFSTHTLTTVGYGSISPNSFGTNVVAAIEALTGLMGFAVATGLLVGRVSRPTARIAFSGSVLIAPYGQGDSLQFRIANQRKNSLMEIEAKVMLMTVDETSNGLKRDYAVLRLERQSIYFFPLTWTIVHPIDRRSPLWEKTAEDLERLQAEVLILIKGFDETFSQIVHARYSYRYDEIVWGAKFAPAFHVSEEGVLVLEVDRVGELRNSSPELREGS
ncbi:MAG: Ion transport 2 domain protein [Bryobacterales bacterium]|nr:Ion transport 2 domain protein [Bryobacterales bacterium]